MGHYPHQVQRKLEVRVDSDRPLCEYEADTPETYPRIFGNYVMQPTQRAARWTPIMMAGFIQLSAKRHRWRVEITEELKNLGDADE